MKWFERVKKFDSFDWTIIIFGIIAVAFCITTLLYRSDLTSRIEVLENNLIADSFPAGSSNEMYWYIAVDKGTLAEIERKITTLETDLDAMLNTNIKMSDNIKTNREEVYDILRMYLLPSQEVEIRSKYDGCRKNKK